MTESKSAAPRIATIAAAQVPAVPLGEVGAQQVLLGEPRGDGSPLLMGITSLFAGQTSTLIEHDTAEIAYVLSGSGWMVGEDSKHPFAAGDAILIDARCWHAIQAGADDVRMLYVFPTAGVPPTRAHERAKS